MSSMLESVFKGNDADEPHPPPPAPKKEAEAQEDVLEEIPKTNEEDINNSGDKNPSEDSEQVLKYISIHQQSIIFIIFTERNARRRRE
jgi:hypothetical protein